MLDIFTNLSNWCCFTDRNHAGPYLPCGKIVAHFPIAWNFAMYDVGYSCHNLYEI